MKIKEVSKERKKYLNKIKLNRFLVILTQILILVGFLVIWEALANANRQFYNKST